MYLCAFVLNVRQSVVDVQPDLLSGLSLLNDGRLAKPPPAEFCDNDVSEKVA